MVFSSTITKRTVIGNVRTSYGNFTSGGTTGGDVATGLTAVDFFAITHKDTAVEANCPVANETFPDAPAAITIVTDSGKDGVWMAIGR